LKLFTTVILLALCSSVSANDGEMLSKVKMQATANIDKRISYLQELKSCVSAATDKEGMKKCRADHKTKVKTLKDENESFRGSMKEERKAKRKR